MANQQPYEDIKNYLAKYPLRERGAYFLDGYAKELLRVMDKYKDIDTTSIFYQKVYVEDLINEEIADAIKAFNKDLKSKRERYNVAERKLQDLVGNFLNLFKEQAAG